MSVAVGIFIVIALLCANAFFVAAEFSLVSVQKDKIKTHKSYRAQVAAKLLQRLTLHLTGSQLGITGMALLLGFVAEPTIGELIEKPIENIVGESSARGVSIFVTLAFVTLLHMIFGEQIPKILAVSRPLGTSLALAPAVRIYSLLVFPVVATANGLANWILRRLGIEPAEELSNVRSREDLEDVFKSSGGEVKEVNLLTRSLQFGEQIAMDALVPRVSVESIGADVSVNELVKKSIDTGYSRFPVTNGDLDDVCGMVHIKSVHKLPRNQWASKTVSQIMVDVLAVPETISLSDLLSDMGKKRSPLAIAVDEHGGTSGIVTAEDILERIVGDISDKQDEPAQESVGQVSEGVFIFSGSVLIEDIELECGFTAPEGPFETLAGFMLFRLQRIPRPKELLHYKGWWFEVVEMESNRIINVKVSQPRDFSKQRNFQLKQVE